MFVSNHSIGIVNILNQLFHIFDAAFKKKLLNTSSIQIVHE